MSTVTRVVDSAAYANYQRVVGAAPLGSPVIGHATIVWRGMEHRRVRCTRRPTGCGRQRQASDVNQQATLNQKAAGDLDLSGVLEPSYTIGLRADVYRDGLFNMGDTVPIVISSGRLNVTTSVRIVGITYDMGDDGTESGPLTVGRPLTSLFDMLAAGKADIDALARRCPVTRFAPLWQQAKPTRPGWTVP